MDQPVYGRPSDGHVTPLFKTGEKCQYYSSSCRTWVNAEVVATRGDGCILVDVEDDTWFNVALQRTKFRDQSGTLRGRVRVVPSPVSGSPVQGSEDELDEDELERSRDPSRHANEQSRPSAVRETAAAERPRREERPNGRRVERELIDVSDDEDDEEALLLDAGDGLGNKSRNEPDALPDRRCCGCRKVLCTALLLGALALNVAAAPDQIQKLCPRSPLPELCEELAEKAREVQRLLPVAGNTAAVVAVSAADSAADPFLDVAAVLDAAVADTDEGEKEEGDQEKGDQEEGGSPSETPSEVPGEGNVLPPGAVGGTSSAGSAGSASSADSAGSAGSSSSASGAYADVAVVMFASNKVAGSRSTAASLQTLAKFGDWMGPVVFVSDNPMCVELLQKQYPADTAALKVVGVARMPTFHKAEAQKAEVFKHLAAANVTAKTIIYMESDVLVGAPIKLLLDYIRQPPYAGEDLMMFGSGAGPDAAGNGGKPDASVLVLRDTQVARECLSEWSAEVKRHATGASPADPGMADVAVLRDAWTETSCFKDGSVTMLPVGWERPGLFVEPDLASMAQGRRAVFMHFDISRWKNVFQTASKAKVKAEIAAYFNRVLGMEGDLFARSGCVARGTQGPRR